MSTPGFRVKIPRSAQSTDATAALQPQRPLETPTNVPGTFITAMPPLPEPSMKELEINAVNAPYSYSRVSYNDRSKEYHAHGNCVPISNVKFVGE